MRSRFILRTLTKPAEQRRCLGLRGAPFARKGSCDPCATVLGADTTVVLNGEVLNKPNDLQEAERMLRALSGRVPQVHTGIAAVSSNRERAHIETTHVSFRAIFEDELVAYLATGDSLEKPGAYRTEGYAARWIPRVEGDFFNVMGLPLAATVGEARNAAALFAILCISTNSSVY